MTKELHFTIRPYKEEAADYIAEAWGFHHLFLWTAEPLQDARKKYAQLGFVITDKERMTDWTLDGSEVYEERWDKDL